LCSIGFWSPWTVHRLQCVLPHAIALARCLDAQLMLLHVLSRQDKQDRLRAVDPLEWQLRRAEAESYLQDVCVRVREAGVSCEAQVNNGDAAEQIVDCARDNEVGLVLIASHGQSGLSDWNVSSVVQKVVVRASTSLMIVRAVQPAQADIASLRYQRVLVPLDSSARAECVLPLAAALTRVPDTQILLTHVVQRPPMPRRTPPSREDTELADRIVYISHQYWPTTALYAGCLRPGLYRHPHPRVPPSFDFREPGTVGTPPGALPELVRHPHPGAHAAALCFHGG